MEPKPLTKEQLEHIATLQPAGLLADLIAAEAYWRIAVKNADEAEVGCNFCKATVQQPNHAPDCAWVRARE